MAWIESHVEIGEHPKIFKLMELLSIDAQKAVGAIHLLWHFTMKYAWRDGNLDRFGEMAVARGAKWEGDPKEFIKALQSAGFLEGLQVHDWMDCAGRLVTDRLYNEKRRKTAQGSAKSRSITAQNAVKRRQSGATNPTNPTLPTVPNLTLPNHTPPTGDSGGLKGNGFDVFWQAYPRHVGKQSAIKAWGKLKPAPEPLKKILEALERQKQSEQWQREGGRFIPHPATWINGKRWEDEISQTPAGGKYAGIKYNQG
ncbi:MAG: hypothetical protein HY401_04200 [Elusimicrobia bacterium]|nr:hypothetical protein [Elusimicrobiota bacterium]